MDSGAIILEFANVTLPRPQEACNFEKSSKCNIHSLIILNLRAFLSGPPGVVPAARHLDHAEAPLESHRLQNVDPFLGKLSFPIVSAHGQNPVPETMHAFVLLFHIGVACGSAGGGGGGREGVEEIVRSDEKDENAKNPIPRPTVLIFEGY